MMKKVEVFIEWASDGGIWAMTKDHLFYGRGDTIEEAVAEMKEGMVLHVKHGKEDGYPYPAWLDEPYELELEYDVVSMLQYARELISDTKLAKFIGIPAAQLGRYANEKAKPREPQRRKIIAGLHKIAAQLNSIPM